MIAISFVAKTCFDLLLEETSERGVNQISANGMTPLLLACEKCYNAAWVQSLMKKGAYIEVDALTLCIGALTKTGKSNPPNSQYMRSIIALGSKVLQQIPDGFANVFETLTTLMASTHTCEDKVHSFVNSLDDKMAKILRQAFLRAYGREVNSCIDHLLEVETLEINRMPAVVQVTPLDVAFRAALRAPHETLPFFKSIISKLCKRGARMHRPLNSIRTKFSDNFTKLREMAPLLASVSKTSQEAGYYTLDFLVGDEVACEWQHITDAFLQQQGLDGPPPPDHPAFDQYALFSKHPARSLLISTVQESNGFMEDPVAIAYNDLLIPAQHLLPEGLWPRPVARSSRLVTHDKNN